MLDIKLIKIIEWEWKGMTNAVPRSYSSWLFNCELPVREFPTEEEAMEYQKEMEENKEEMLC